MPRWSFAVRRVALGLCALCASGCADLLGLDGLSYEEAQVSATGGSAAVDGVGGGPDGDIPIVDGDLDTSESEYPRLFDRAAVITAVPFGRGAPYYWVYEPSSESLSSFVYDATEDDLLGSQSWMASDTFTQVAVIPGSDVDTLIGYNTASGFVSQVTGAIGSGDLTRLSDDVGTSGRTELFPLYTESGWLAFTYSAEDGNYRYFRPLPSEEPAVFAGASELGWTSMVSFSWQGDDGVLKHNSETNVLAFDRFVAHGSPLEPVAEVELTFPATLVRAFVLGGEAAILLYEGGRGEVRTARLKQADDGGPATLELLESGYFRGDLTQIVPLDNPEAPVALTFSASSGQAAVRNLSPLDDVSNVVVR